MRPVYSRTVQNSRSIASACKLLFRAHDVQPQRRSCRASAAELLAGQLVLKDTFPEDISNDILM